MKYGFLLNHYAPHQLYHSVPIAFALSVMDPAAEVIIMASQTQQLDAARKIGEAYPGHRCRFVRLKIDPFLELASKTLGRFMSVNIRKATLRANIAAFQDLDVLIVPEKNSLALKREPGCAHLKFVRIRHGAGDRETGLDDSNKAFDLVLASGQKMIDRLIEADNATADRCRIVGYPKFDVLKTQTPPKKIFDNGRTTVLYNPHFKPDESSWPSMGLEVLEFFKNHPEYNLIFAPHIMLYKRGGRRHGAKSLLKYRFCKNIYIDTGSLKSVDMSYTRQADIYLGDVSSQIYEFLYRPRPCIFLNPHQIDWTNDVTFLHWKGGQVLTSVSQLEEALKTANAKQASYELVQKNLFAYTFDLTDELSASRAARAVSEFFQA